MYRIMDTRRRRSSYVPQPVPFRRQVQFVLVLTLIALVLASGITVAVSAR